MWVIVTRNQCNFCDDAKALLKGYGHSFVTYNVQEPSSKWVLNLIKQAGYTTVPQVFDPDGKHIGGYTELKEHLNGSSVKV
jgi:glutaredoxin